MPKELKVHPNERLDIGDFDLAASEYTSERVSFESERQVLDRRSRVLEGFRVRIEDQSASAGQITVFNGTGLDRDGNSLHDEDQANTSVTLTLAGANSTFYLEIELVESETDTDARNFWDPTFSNTAPTPDGAEASLTVSTRRTPTWRVVQPVSTTAFASTADPNSLRVPLAILSTDGSNIIDGTSTPGLVQVDAASVTETSVGAGGTSIRVFNSRLLGGIGDQVTLGFGLGTAELVTLSANDLDNGILTFGATSNAHSPGEIVQAAGVGRLMREKTDPNEAAAHPDLVPRMWQGNEVRGGALLQSKESVTGRDDLNIRALKDKVDALDAILREVKFGAFDPATVNSDPPIAFPTRPRYVHPVGSLAGARYATVSIGNGTTSFGDYNGATDAPFTAAITFLTARGGGVLAVKAGTYTFASTVAVGVPITIIGVGKEDTTITSNVAAAPAFAFTLSAADDANKVIMKDIQLTVGTGSEQAVTLETVSLVCENVDFICGVGLIGGTSIESRIIANACSFQPPIGATAGILALAASSFEETLVDSSFTNCTFSEATKAIPALVCTLNNVTFVQCAFTGSAVFTSSTGALAFSDIGFYNCQMDVAGFVSSVTGTTDRYTMLGCSVTLSAGAASTSMFLFTGAVTNVSIENTSVASTWTGTGAGTQGRILRFSAGVTGLSVRDCKWLSNTGQAVDMIAFEAASAAHSGITIDGNIFTTFYRGVRFVTTGTTRATTIANNLFDASVENLEQQGVLVEDGYWEGTVRDNRFSNFNSGTAFLKRGVTIEAPTSGGANAKIINNAFDIGTSGNPAAADSAAVWIDGTTSVELETVVSFNKIDAMYGVGNIYGINVIGGGTAPFQSIQIIGNQSTGVISSTGGAGTVSAGIRVINANSCTIANNKIAETSVASADTAAIYLSSLKSGIVQGNEVYGPIVSGSPSNFEAGIYLTGTNTNVRICDNVVRETSFSTVQHGIRFATSAASDNVSIDNNMVFLGTNMIRGIIQSGTGGLKSFTCNGNRVAGMAAPTTVTGIDIQLGDSAFNIQVNNNMVSETTWDASHTGISVEGNTGFEATCVQVNNNIVRGDLAGSGTRSSTTIGFGIELRDLRVFQCNSNLLDWADASIQAVSLFVSECEHGSVIGNVVRPGTSGGVADITIASTVGGQIVGGNICGSTGQGTGVLSNTATDNLQGADNTSTDFTNKVS